MALMRLPHETHRGPAEEDSVSVPSGNPPGAPPSRSGDGNGPPLFKVASQFVRDPEERPSALVLAGYLGPSKSEEYYRLYLGLDFRAYYEIPRKGILYIEPPDPAEETRPTKLILDTDKVSKLELVQTLETKFLQGSIAAALPPGNQPYQVNLQLGIQPTYYPTCVPPTPGGQPYQMNMPLGIQPTLYPTCVPSRANCV
jgi:hypothetical protein